MLEVRKFFRGAILLEQEYNFLKTQIIVEEESGRDCTKYKALLQKLVEQIDEKKSGILRAIQSIDEPSIRIVLELHYLDGMTAEQIAIHTNYSLRQVFRKLEEGDVFLEKIYDNGGVLKVEVGDRVYIPTEMRAYTVRARDDRYIICTKPYNAHHTVLYFIIDLVDKWRAPDDRLFCSGYETDEQCLERLKELQEGKIKLSRRRGIPLDIEIE